MARRLGDARIEGSPGPEVVERALASSPRGSCGDEITSELCVGPCGQIGEREEPGTYRQSRAAPHGPRSPRRKRGSSGSLRGESRREPWRCSEPRSEWCRRPAPGKAARPPADRESSPAAACTRARAACRLGHPLPWQVAQCCSYSFCALLARRRGTRCFDQIEIGDHARSDRLDLGDHIRLRPTRADECSETGHRGRHVVALGRLALAREPRGDSTGFGDDVGLLQIPRSSPALAAVSAPP